MTDQTPVNTFDLIDRLSAMLVERRGDHRGAISAMLAEIAQHADQVYRSWLDWCVNGDDKTLTQEEKGARHALAQLACMTLEQIHVLGGDPETELQLAARHVLTELDKRE